MASKVTFPDFKIKLCLLICFIGIASASSLIPSATNVVSSLIPTTLSTNFYLAKCPDALPTIKKEITLAVWNQPRLGASLLRLHFHDCFVQGCDASVLLKDTSTFKGEQTAFPNVNSLRGFDVIDKVKTKLETICPNTVSCADILAVAARDSVVALGGPSWAVRVGRRDSTTADFNAANSDLPSPFLDLKPLIAAFGKKGFSADEMVALSGAHTIGRSKCALFRNRIYNESNIEFFFANSLKRTCPKIGGDNNLSPLDTTTPDFFDTTFYKNLLVKRGLLHSDQQLYSGGSTNNKVLAYAINPFLFRNDFANAMLKMSNLSPPIGYPSQIRKYCGRVN